MWCDEISIFHTRTREAFSSFFFCCFSLLFVMPYPCIVPINPLHLSSSLSSTHTTHTHAVEHRALNDDAATLAVSCPLYAIDSGSARNITLAVFDDDDRDMRSILLIRVYWFCHIFPPAHLKVDINIFYKSTHDIVRTTELCCVCFSVKCDGFRSERCDSLTFRLHRQRG